MSAPDMTRKHKRRSRKSPLYVTLNRRLDHGQTQAQGFSSAPLGEVSSMAIGYTLGQDGDVRVVVTGIEPARQCAGAP